MHRRGEPSIRNRAQHRRAAWMAGSIALIITVVAVTWSLTAGVPAAGKPSPKSGAPAVLTPSVPLAGAPLGGTPAVGALFTTIGGQLGTHFCTASVVDSPTGDLLVTAAHCMKGYSDAAPAGLAFVPGYDNGTAPYGVWAVVRIFADSAWSSAADPDHDVAFLAVAQPGRNTRIETVTGAEHLSIGHPPGGVVRVIGYPATQNQPISCQNRISAVSSSQLEFDCDAFAAGTSGSPFLIGVDKATGAGTVIGVIGGYQQGGDSPDVSYATSFGQNVRTLYDAAVSQANAVPPAARPSART